MGQPVQARSGRRRSRPPWKTRRMLSYSRTEAEERMAEWLGDSLRTPSRPCLEAEENIGMGLRYDGEVVGIAEALEKGLRARGVLILADLTAAIQAVKRAGRTGKARTGELVRVIRDVRSEVRLGQGSHGHLGQRGADERAKTKVARPEVPTERGIKQLNELKWAGVEGE